jgi:hypothetical protein
MNSLRDVSKLELQIITAHEVFICYYFNHEILLLFQSLVVVWFTGGFLAGY